MSFISSQNSYSVFKECKIPLISSYPVIRPTETSFGFKSLKNAVDFHIEGELSCDNSWDRDVKSTHIRNRRLLDLPYKKPKCCSDIYNIIVDRQKLKKIQKYGLTRPERTRTRPKCKDIKTCEAKQIPGKESIVYVPECYQVEESSSDEESDEYESCKSGSVSICSGCFGETRTKMHKIIKKDFGDLLRTNREFCKEEVAEEFKKHKLGKDFKLNLSKVF